MARIVPAQSMSLSDYIWCNIKPLTCNLRGPTGIDPRPHVVPSVCELFARCCSTRDAEQLQEDLSNLVMWSDSAGLNFNYSKCKGERITRKLKPSSLSIIWPALSMKLSVPRRLCNTVTFRDPFLIENSE